VNTIEYVMTVEDYCELAIYVLGVTRPENLCTICIRRRNLQTRDYLFAACVSIFIHFYTASPGKAV